MLAVVISLNSGRYNEYVSGGHKGMEERFDSNQVEREKYFLVLFNRENEEIIVSLFA